MSRSRLEVLAVFLMFVLSLGMYLVWFTAFVAGGRVTVAINEAGEMWLEYVVWMVVTAVICVGFTDYLKRGVNED
jgi:hypothetical protein